MMKIKTLIYISVVMLSIGFCVPARSQTCFNFENGYQGWEIPVWAFEQKDYVGESAGISSEQSSKGDIALKLMCDFPSRTWAAAIVEFEAKQSLEDERFVSADVFLPRKGKHCQLKARIIVTLGSGWWIMKGKAVELKAGCWNMVTAKFDELTPEEEICAGTAPGNTASAVDLGNIRKIAIRIERDASAWDTVKRYKGPIYFDNIVVGRDT